MNTPTPELIKSLPAADAVYMSTVAPPLTTIKADSLPTSVNFERLADAARATVAADVQAVESDTKSFLARACAWAGVLFALAIGAGLMALTLSRCV